MNLKTSPSAPQQVAFKRVCSQLYTTYGDEIMIDGLDATREYVTGCMLKELQAADAATLGRVLGVLEGVPARSAGRVPTRHYALALVALYLESASWDTLALVAETLHGGAGQAVPPGRPASPAREGFSFPVLASSAARLRAGIRAGFSALTSFPFRAFATHFFLKRVVLPFLGFVLAVALWAAEFLLVRASKSVALRLASRSRQPSRGRGTLPARPINPRAQARKNTAEVSHGDG